MRFDWSLRALPCLFLVPVRDNERDPDTDLDGRCHLPTAPWQVPAVTAGWTVNKPPMLPCDKMFLYGKNA